MLAAVISLSLLGAGLGLALGFASRKFAVEGNPLVDELVAMMPGSNCGQCGFPGCTGAAAAIAEGTAPPTCCPPGGKALAAALADRLGISTSRRSSPARRAGARGTTCSSWTSRGTSATRASSGSCGASAAPARC